MNGDRRTIFNWLKALTTAGIEGLLRDKRFGKQKGVMDTKIRAVLEEKPYRLVAAASLTQRVNAIAFITRYAVETHVRLDLLTSPNSLTAE